MQLKILSVQNFFKTNFLPKEYCTNTGTPQTKWARLAKKLIPVAFSWGFHQKWKTFKNEKKIGQNLEMPQSDLIIKAL